MMNLIEQIRRAMRQSPKSRYRLARDCGVSEAQLSRLASGKRGLSVGNLEKLAAALGLQVVLKPRARREAR